MILRSPRTTSTDTLFPYTTRVRSIRRRGWNESGPTKIFLRALRSSVMSLHEVSEVEPGSGFRVRDLIRGGEPLRVSERSASPTLKQWDRIGARVVQVGGKHLLSGDRKSTRLNSSH